MRAFVVLALLLAAPAAAAQTGQWPRTVPMVHDGKPAGTATFTGNRIYLRNVQGELFAQIILAPDGSRTLLDPHGKVLDQQAAPAARELLQPGARP